MEIKSEACDYCGSVVPVDEMVYLSVSDVYYVADGEEVGILNLYILACSTDCLTKQLIEHLESDG